MRSTSTLVTSILLFGMNRAAFADSEDAAEALRARPVLVDMGKVEVDRLDYDVLTLKADDGYLKARIVDRESGERVKTIFDPATGQLLRAKPAG